ncbi:hypothetical protein [Polyangium sp. y55x31]|uniref:hypothetical protein n=1 Tax=Polyangium sp. y55x31 TaxID=3042688 RepID=UPI0024821A35|nr:hypothetical protein [Polyangium sp. y55x31]MDI1476421.1 hypothetical protein [Polyangium sp. y55x31]
MTGKNESKAGTEVRAAEKRQRPDGAEAARILRGYKAKKPAIGPEYCAACGLVAHPRLRVGP